MKRQNRQSGFSVIEVVVAVAAIAIIGVAGWFVYQHNRVKVSDAAAGGQTTNQGTNQQQSTTPPAATTVVKIPELGIQITVPNDMKDLTYSVKTLTMKDGSQSPTAFFTTSALTALDANCAGVNTPLGTLGRDEGQYPSGDPTAALDYGQLVKQFPTFYIAAGYPNGTCSTKSSVAASVNKFKAEFEAALPTIEALN